MIRSGEWLDIKEMYRDGVSISEIARRTGHDRKTVRRVVTKDGVAPRSRVGQARGSILEPYREYIRCRVEEGVLNSCKVLREIQGQGYGGGITLVREFMHPLRPPSRERAVIRYETEPGEQAQLDLGVFPYLDENGVHCQVYGFAMVLSYSRLLTLEFFEKAPRVNVLRAIKHGLEFFQGTPKTLLSDNMKQLVDEIDSSGRPVWAEEYLSMADHYGFMPRACKPYRPATKGKIERPIRYIRESFWSGLSFQGLDDLNVKGRIWRDDVANTRVHGTTHEVPVERYSREFGYLQALNKRPYETCRVETRKVSRDCYVTWDTNCYSVPWEHAGQEVLVRESESGLITVEFCGNVIASHVAIDGRFKVLRSEDHFRGICPTQVVAKSKPTARQMPAPDVEQRPLSVYESLLEGQQWKQH